MLQNDKVAVILPLAVAVRFKRLFKEYRRELHTGKEYYNGGVTSVNILGSVDIRFFRRIWAMSESGIKVWWQKLLDPRGYLYTSHKAAPKSANLKGNILVVFVVWSVGIGVAVLQF